MLAPKLPKLLLNGTTKLVRQGGFEPPTTPVRGEDSGQTELLPEVPDREV